MSMQAASLEALEKANVTTALVSALAQVFDFEFAARRADFPTKQDVTEIRHDVMEVRQDVNRLGTETKQEFAQVRAEMKQGMTDLRHGLELKIADVKTELKDDLNAASSNYLRQMYMALLGQMAVLLGLAYFFVTHLKN